MAVRCEACGREGEWPSPEVGCGSCGTVALIPVHPPESADPDAPDPGPGEHAASGARDGVRTDGRTDGRADAQADARADALGRGPGRGTVGGRSATSGTDRVSGTDASAEHSPAADLPAPTDPPAPTDSPAADRAPFRPVTIRTGRDAVVTAALYLRWLGFRDVPRPDGSAIPSAAVDLRAPGVIAQVDPTTAPAGLRAVECVWLNGLTASAASVYFSLAGYTTQARERADHLGVPLFIMDLTGTPQPVNDPADRLIASGA
ncbi:hypothetical protein ABT236_34670 [Streptomyces sp. NPDC001523]|uniref:hypothetical protein n=1 Tax=Streptomyces sp. NPDC001523 TaxID=3154383 RepID=UPI00331FB499